MITEQNLNILNLHNVKVKYGSEAGKPKGQMKTNGKGRGY